MNAFLANLISIPVIDLASNEQQNIISNCDNADPCKSEKVEPARLDQLEKQQKFRFYDFVQHRIPTKLQSAFVAGLKIHCQNLTPELINYRKLKGHLFEERFCADMEIHMRQHRQQFKSWESVSSANAKGYQVPRCQWVFKYKTDKHDQLQKYKARLVVCDNQQKCHDLPTRATTLAITSLHVLLALVAKFDLETLQLDAVNVFVHANLDETVFIKMPPGYNKQGKVLKLNKTLYGLRQSPLLWQQKLTDKIKKVGFEEIPQKPCVVQKNNIICFFYVNNIVFAFKKNQRKEVEKTIDSLSKALTIERKRELK